jgi:hypothetical protein
MQNEFRLPNRHDGCRESNLWAPSNLQAHTHFKDHRIFVPHDCFNTEEKTTRLRLMGITRFQAMLHEKK